jgi:hypothetical protein
LTYPAPKARPPSDEEDEELPKLKNPFFFFECDCDFRRFCFGGGAVKKPPKNPLCLGDVLLTSTKDPEARELREDLWPEDR